MESGARAAAGGELVAAASLVFVANFHADVLGVDDYVDLLHYDVPAGWPPDECPLCRDGVPVDMRNAPGKELLAAQKERQP